MQSERLEKIVVSTGLGKLRQRQGFKETILPEITKALTDITGQKPSETIARKSIAGFKLREGDVVGLKVTLRGKRKDDFLKKLVETTLPRIRDFRGIDPKQIDGQGNLTMGIREHIVFPEINPDEVKFDFGLEITLVSNIKDKQKSYELFKSLGVPLKEEENG
jgi:large subunit ribosomal protein L5